MRTALALLLALTFPLAADAAARRIWWIPRAHPGSLSSPGRGVPMIRLAPVAALLAVALLAVAFLAGSGVSSKRRPAHRSPAESACPLRLDSLLPPVGEQVDAATPADSTYGPPDGLDETLASLASIARAPIVDDEPIFIALISMTRRLLQGDLALARAIAAEIDRPALAPQVRNLCILLLAFTEEPRTWEALRANALAADDDAATLAVEALEKLHQFDKDSPDDDLRTRWVSSYFAHASILDPGFYVRHDWDDYRRRFTSLAPPAEGEEGIEEGPSLDPRTREVFVAVARHGASMEARVLAIGRLAGDRESVDLLRAFAREDATPDRVKSAVYRDLHVRTDDFDFLVRDAQRSKDPQFLATLCAPILRSAGPREGEALALMEGLVPLADANATLGEAMMSAFLATWSTPRLQAIERVARSAASDTFRRQAVSALCTRNRDKGAYAEERLAILGRLSWDPSAGLAAEGALGLLTWARREPEVASSAIYDALLQRAAALALMPVVPEKVRGELTEELARRKKTVR